MEELIVWKKICCFIQCVMYDTIVLYIVKRMFEMGLKMSNTISMLRKIKLYPVGDKEEIDRVYEFIRNGQYAQYQAQNLLMGQLIGKYYECGRDIKSDLFKKAQKEILCNSNPLLSNIEFAKGVDTKSSAIRKVSQDFSVALKNGLARGERTVTNYKRTVPLSTRSRDLKFSHHYKSYQEFLDNIMNPDLKIYIDWVNHIRFEVVLGNPHNSEYLRKEIQNIFEERYKVQGSSIQINEKSIILNLTIQVPKNKNELNEKNVVGVDLGLAIPAVCSLNNSEYVRMNIGHYEDFVRVRTQMQQQRRRIQGNLKYSKGGHGRKKKLAALEKYKNYEHNFVQSYNHMISKNVIEFALKNHAKYINIEDLSGYNADDFVLRNWSYYQLQNYITYKAEKEGIIVRKVKPYYTSQRC